MSSFRTLSDDEIANVLSYVRSESKWGNKASLVTPEEVKAIRAATKDRDSSWTEKDLLAVPVTKE